VRADGLSQWCEAHTSGRPVMIESAAIRPLMTHMLCWIGTMHFSAAASSENDQGSMNESSFAAGD
jgi:hypothetical protein